MEMNKADMVADIEMDKVADMEVDKVADMVADMKVGMVADMVVDEVADMQCYNLVKEFLKARDSREFNFNGLTGVGANLKLIVNY